MTVFTVKDWRNATTHEGGGDTSTPISAAALEDLETRVTSSGGRTVTSGAAAQVPLTLKGAAAQSGDLLQFQNSAGTNLGGVDFGGAVHVNDANGNLHRLTSIAGGTDRAAAHYWYATNGLGTNGLAWSMAIDVAAATPYRDFALAKVETGGSVTDTFYISHRGADAPTIGLGYVPPSTTYRVSISGEDSESGMGALVLRVAAGNTGNPLAILDSATGLPRWTINNNIRINPLIAEANTGSYPRTTFELTDSGGGSVYSFRHESANAVSFYYVTGGAPIFTATGSSELIIKSTTLGFYSHAATAQQVLATGGGASVDNVITALQNLGLVKQS